MADSIEPNPDFLSKIKTYEACLGKGGFGIVLKAIDTSNATTAIKFIFIDRSNDSQRKTILREAVPKNLEEHPNIVKVINAQKKTFSAEDIEEIFKDISSIDEQRAQYIARANARFAKTLESFCIQMELCGENLREWLNTKYNANDLHVKIRQTRIIQGMITGLKFLHENKIIHRDLKPENIMFSKGKYQLPVKIGDFGLCRRIHSEESRTGSLTSAAGTKSYMAPEAYGRDYDHQADLYSLGLIIWEVSQLIGSHIRQMFDKLVNDKEEELVNHHPIMTGIKEIIIGLTKRKTADRTKTLDDIQVDNWDQQLLYEVRNKECSRLWTSILNCEKNWIAKTSQELKLCLDNAHPGCIINLEDGEYFGSFIVNEDGVHFVGNGSGTVLQPDESEGLIIFGSGCTISNVKIISSNFGIILRGSNNTVKQVESTDTNDVIILLGGQNTVDNVTMTNIKRRGIELSSNGNTISNITGLNVRHGIIVTGLNNNLTNINFQAGSYDSLVGMYLGAGAFHNQISNLTCTGYSSDKKDWGLYLGEGSSNCTVVDSVCGPVKVKKNNDLILTNVDCGEVVYIQGAEGLELNNCRGKNLDADKPVKTRHCQFENEFIY